MVGLTGSDNVEIYLENQISPFLEQDLSVYSDEATCTLNEYQYPAAAATLQVSALILLGFIVY